MSSWRKKCLSSGPENLLQLSSKIDIKVICATSWCLLLLKIPHSFLSEGREKKKYNIKHWTSAISQIIWRLFCCSTVLQLHISKGPCKLKTPLEHRRRLRGSFQRLRNHLSYQISQWLKDRLYQQDTRAQNSPVLSNRYVSSLTARNAGNTAWRMYCMKKGLRKLFSNPFKISDWKRTASKRHCCEKGKLQAFLRGKGEQEELWFCAVLCSCNYCVKLPEPLNFSKHCLWPLAVKQQINFPYRECSGTDLLVCKNPYGFLNIEELNQQGFTLSISTVC